jgi:DNA-3-methyladenine glycosylase II
MAEVSITNAISNIKRNDPIMGQVIDVVGDYRLAVDKSPFRMLIRSIAGQQLSVAAAGTIWYRFLTTNGGRRVSPNSLAKLTDDSLRNAGLSHAKIRSIRNIQDAFSSRAYSVSKLRKLPNEEISNQLQQLKGIGPWTADMFLMFAIGRLDVFPVGDLGIANAIELFYGFDGRPDSEAMNLIADKWSPYRTIASWYCWQGLDYARLHNWRPSPRRNSQKLTNYVIDD